MNEETKPEAKLQEDFSQYGYELLVMNEGDVTSAKIEKTGIKADFTIAEMRGQQAKVEKIIKELAGKFKLELAKSENIREHHPNIAAMSMEDLFAAHMFYESMALVTTLPKQIEEMQELLDDSKREEQHIATVLGLDLTEKPSVAEVAEDAMEKLENGTAEVQAEPANDNG